MLLHSGSRRSYGRSREPWNPFLGIFSGSSSLEVSSEGQRWNLLQEGLPCPACGREEETLTQEASSAGWHWGSLAQCSMSTREGGSVKACSMHEQRAE